MHLNVMGLLKCFRNGTYVSLINLQHLEEGRFWRVAGKGGYEASRCFPVKTCLL